jgi:hypothetical protein
VAIRLTALREQEPDGRLLKFDIGPDDRTVESDGRWQLDPGNNLILEPTKAAASKSVMQLLRDLCRDRSTSRGG